MTQRIEEMAMERNQRAVPALLAGALLAGCGSMPQQNDMLEQARSLVQTLEREPTSDRVAREQLAAARNAIEQADAQSGERRGQEDVEYHSYVALRNAQIAEQLVSTERARAELQEAETARTRVLLEAREREAELAGAEAREARAAADARASQLEQQAELAESAQQRITELEAELESLQAEQTERGLVVTLGDVLFETDQAELQPGAATMLDRLAGFLAEYPERRIIIEGHTDSTGAAEYNERLSERRADAVRRALLERGVSGDRVETRGLGEEYPVATNDTSAGRQLNRRVEIVISDEDGRFEQEAERTVRATPRER